MKNKMLGLLLIGLLFIFFSSCKKEKAMEPCNICNKDTSFEAMKEWCYFKEGSWWVYEEENSGETDSVYVDYTILDDAAEAFEYGVHSTWYDNDFNYRHNPGYIGGSNVSSCEIRRLHRTQSSPGNFVGGGLIANFPPIEGETSADQSGEFYSAVRTNEIYSDFELNGIDFDSTIFYTVGHAGSEDWDSLAIHISQHYGIIRKELPQQNRTWTLIDYHIIQ